MSASPRAHATKISTGPARATAIRGRALGLRSPLDGAGLARSWTAKLRTPARSSSSPPSHSTPRAGRAGPSMTTCSATWAVARALSRCRSDLSTRSRNRPAFHPGPSASGCPFGRRAPGDAEGTMSGRWCATGGSRSVTPAGPSMRRWRSDWLPQTRSAGMRCDSSTACASSGAVPPPLAMPALTRRPIGRSRRTRERTRARHHACATRSYGSSPERTRATRAR